jgi:hypothetical protein
VVGVLAAKQWHSWGQITGSGSLNGGEVNIQSEHFLFSFLNKF